MPESTPRPATAPLAETLPFFGISPGRFESFVRDLVSELPNVVSCRKHGVPGDQQGGIDLLATTSDGATIAYQCKREKVFNAGDFKVAAKKATYKSDHYVLVLACEAKEAVRKEERRRRKWTVLDGAELCTMVRKLDVEVGRRLVLTHFGNAAVRDFLGLQPFTPMQAPEDYFRPLLDQGKTFNHLVPLVGREKELARLLEFANGTKLVFVLPGRGGVGKSKLLHEFAKQAEATKTVRFVRQDVPVTVESLDELPRNDCIIVVDDAHRRTDLGVLLSYARETQTKIVLSTRPQLTEYTPCLMAEHGIDMDEVSRAEALAELSFEQVLELAHRVLGEDLKDMAWQLARVTKDCPLVTVVGGRLLRDREVEPALLSTDEQFRDTALSRFFADILEYSGRDAEDDSKRKVLEIIAALAPVSLRSSRFAHLVETLAGLDAGRAVALCEEFEERGILARNEDGCRIVPDVLSDYVLGVACGVDGAPTGFVEQIVQATGEVDPVLLRNLAAVDWRASRTKGKDLSLLGSVWGKVVETFDNAANSDRIQMLRGLKDVGFFLPSKLLEIVQVAIDFPSSTEESGPLAGLVQYEHGDVLSELPGVLSVVVANGDTLERGADLLWRLALDDNVKLPRGVGERDAIGVLRDAMSYSSRKPKQAHERLLSRVETWLENATTERERSAVASIVTPLFGRTWVEHRIEGSSYLVIQPASVADLRKRAMSLIETLIVDDSRIVVGHAVDALSSVVEFPRLLGEKALTDEFVETCEAERIEVFGRLRGLVSDNPDGAIAVKVARTVSWYAEKDPNPEIRNAASEVVASIQSCASVSLAGVIHNPWGDVPNGEGARLALQKAANDLVSKGSPLAAVEEIGESVDGLVSLELGAYPGVLLDAVAKANQQFAQGMFETLARGEHPGMAANAGSLLHEFRVINIDRFHELVSLALGSRMEKVCASIAAAYRWWFDGAKEIDPRDLEHFEALFRMGGEVAIAGLQAIPHLTKLSPRTAAALVADLQLGDSLELAGQFCETFNFSAGLWEEIRSEELHRCVLKLVPIPRLDDYRISDFLDKCGSRAPLAVIELLLERMRREKVESFLRFATIPTHPIEVVIEGAILDDPKYEDLLWRITRCVDDEATWFDAPRVFAIAAGGWNEKATQVLRDISALRSDRSSTFVANCLRGEASRELVLNKPGLVEQVLDDAAAVSRDTFEAVRHALFRCVVPRQSTAELRDSIHAQACACRDGLRVGSKARDLFGSIADELRRNG